MNTIFVSSTFKDMQWERDILQSKVAPALNEIASRFNESVSFCDLRWGVNTIDLESEVGSKKVLDVCLDEIDRCQPPMIVILGYRYGWIPDKNLIMDTAQRKKMQLDDLEKSVTALEIEYGAFVKNPERTLFYFREIEGDYPDFCVSEDEEHLRKLNALKEKIGRLSAGKAKTYRVRWNDQKPEGLDAFSKIVQEDVRALLQPEWERSEKLTPFERERNIHERYIDEKAKSFRARKDYAERLVQEIKAGREKIIIKGRAGMGKSTLFCYLAKRLREEGFNTLPFISGLTQESNDAIDILRYVVHFLEEKLSQPHNENEEKTLSADQLRIRLEELTIRYEKTGKTLVVLIDAVDQLYDDEYRKRLIFQPSTSQNVRFVMTCLKEFPYDGEFETLNPLTPDEKREVVAGILASIHRELDRFVVQEIVAMKASDNPLFISLLVRRLVLLTAEDFAVMKDSRSISDHMIAIIRDCPDDLEEMSAWLLRVASMQINEKLITDCGELLAVSRHGLRPFDLATLTGEYWSELDFIRFLYYMNENFTRFDDGRIDFTHKSIRAGFLRSCDQMRHHRRIVDYLLSLPADDPVKKREVTYHLISTNDKDRFARYIAENHENTESRRFASMDVYEELIKDDGTWLCDLLASKRGKNETEKLIIFVDQNLYARFEPSRHDQILLEKVLQANERCAEVLYQSDTQDNQLGSTVALAETYKQLGQFYASTQRKEHKQKSVACYEKCLPLYEKIHAVRGDTYSKRSLAFAYRSVGYCYINYSSYSDNDAKTKGFALYQKCLQLFEELYEECQTDGAQRDLSMIYESIGYYYLGFSEYEKKKPALSYIEKSLRIAMEQEEKLHTTTTLRDLSESYYQLGGYYIEIRDKSNYPMACEYLEKSLSLMHEVDKRSRSLNSRLQLTELTVFIAQQYYSTNTEEYLRKAIFYYESAIESLSSLDEKLQTMKTKKKLLQFYFFASLAYSHYNEKTNDLESIKRAIPFYQRFVKLSEWMTANGEHEGISLFVAWRYHTIGDLYVKLGGRENLENAVVYYEKAVNASLRKTRNENKPDDHFFNVNILKSIAEVYQRMGNQPEKVLEYNQKIVEIYQRMGDQPEKVLEYYQKVLENRKEIVRNHTITDCSKYEALLQCCYDMSFLEAATPEQKKEYIEQGIWYVTHYVDFFTADKVTVALDDLMNSRKKKLQERLKEIEDEISIARTEEDDLQASIVKLLDELLIESENDDDS